MAPASRQDPGTASADPSGRQPLRHNQPNRQDLT
jgi:hypothetical protein